MKDKVISFVGGLVVCIILCGLLGFEDYVKTNYTREATIVSYYEDSCIAEDNCGNEWCFIGEGYEVGDKVKLYMNTNHTDSNIYDDEIKNVKLIEED